MVHGPWEGTGCLQCSGCWAGGQQDRHRLRVCSTASQTRCAPLAHSYVQLTEGINAYGVSKHRHMPEIEQGLADACGKDVKVR